VVSKLSSLEELFAGRHFDREVIILCVRWYPLLVCRAKIAMRCKKRLALLIGYARVSTTEQETAVQTAALKSAGCEKIFREKASGGRWDRPELQRLLDQLRAGDILVVWKLDRLSRSLRDVLTIMMQMVEAFAEFERAMLWSSSACRASRSASPDFPSSIRASGSSMSSDLSTLLKCKSCWKRDGRLPASLFRTNN
jgi:hypothetical protein